MNSTEVKEAKCYFCGKVVDEEDYCYGCEEYVCQDCVGDDYPVGNHDVTDHQESE